MFDLPSVSNEEKKEYRHFIKLLKKEGFFLVQESVYSKLSTTPYVSQATIKTLQSSVPPDGCIFVLNITEKQFNEMQILLGSKNSTVIDSVERIIEV